MKETEITSETKADRALHIEIGQTKYTIGEYHVDFFEKLQNLPRKHKIIMMGLTVNDLRAYVAEEKKAAFEKVKKLLDKTWYWKETGESVEINQDTIPGVYFTLPQMKSKHRSIETLEKIIEFFEGPDREVYTSADEQND